MVAWGDNRLGQSNVPADLHGVKATAAGAYHNLALCSNGTVIAWGDRSMGQTAVPSAAIQVVAIAAGCQHSLALKKNGTVLAWGDNEYGQTEVPENLSGVTAVAAGFAHSLALKSNGTVVGWGEKYGVFVDYPYTGAATVPTGLKKVTAITAGGLHSLALIAGPVITTQPQDVETSIGSDAEFSVTAIGEEPLSYQWRFNNQIIRSATNSTLDVFNIQPRQAGSYSVLVRNRAGSTLSSLAKLQVTK